MKASSKRSVSADHGKPITRQSKRPTDRAPHMGEYVRVGQRYGKTGCHIVIGNQAFFYPVLQDSSMTDAEKDAHVVWTRDMLCIALDTLVQLEIERRGKAND